MSLHNSTNLENQDWTFLKLVDLRSRSEAGVVGMKNTDQKPSEAGFDRRGGPAKRSGLFGQLEKRWTETE